VDAAGGEEGPRPSAWEIQAPDSSPVVSSQRRLIPPIPEGEADRERREGVTGRYVAFQTAEVAIPRNLFANIPRLIAELRPPPITSTA
jgi:hypothetical protein